MVAHFVPSLAALPAVAGEQASHLSRRHLAIEKVSRNLPVAFLGLELEEFSLLGLAADVLLEEEHTVGQLLVHLLETAVLGDHLLEDFGLHALEGERRQQLMVLHYLALQSARSFLHQPLD